MPHRVLDVLSISYHNLIVATINDIRSKEANNTLNSSDQISSRLPHFPGLLTIRFFVRLFNVFDADLNFRQLRADVIGRLIMLQGTVVRTNGCRPKIEELSFVCIKCGSRQRLGLRDGIFEPPTSCIGANCTSRWFAPDRATARSIDMQMIKVQEDYMSLSLSENSNNNIKATNGWNETPSPAFHNGQTEDDLEVLEFDWDGDLPNSENQPATDNNIKNGSIQRRKPRSIDVELTRSQTGVCMPGDTVRILGVVETWATTLGQGIRSSSVDGGKPLAAQAVTTMGIRCISVQVVNGRRDSGSMHDRRRRRRHALPWGVSAPHVGLMEKALGERLARILVGEKESAKVIDLEADLDACGGFSSHELSFVRDFFSNEKDKFALMVASFCPSIKGEWMVKAALVLSLLGGVPLFTSGVSSSAVSGGGRLKRRGTVHVLLVGPPGVGKSRLLRAAVAVSEKGIYVGGKGSSVAGLTASVARDSSGDLSIEGGVLVLSDGGLCAVDEFDKLDSSQRSFLEAMEQQAVTVAKGGLLCTLRAATSVVAAANPTDGMYRSNRSLSENLKLSVALLSRFDLIFVFGGTNNSKEMNTTHHHQPDSDTSSQELKTRCERRAAHSQDFLPLPLMQTFSRYARSFCKPTLSPAAAKMLETTFMSQRSSSSNSILPVTPRYLETLVRLSQARARCDLARVVTTRHVLDVLEITRSSAWGITDTSDAFKGSSGRQRTGNSVAAKANIVRDVVASQFGKGATITRRDLALAANAAGVEDEGKVEQVIAAVSADGFILSQGAGRWKVNC